MTGLVIAEIQPQRHRGDCKLQEENSALLVAQKPNNAVTDFQSED
jgi:hypothetical protein